MRQKSIKTRQRKPGVSARKKIIRKTLKIIRDIKKHRYGEYCFFCGKHQSRLRFPLSNCHILTVGAHPGLELEFSNIVLACFAPYYYGKQCHNYWEDRVPPHRKQFEDKLNEAKKGNYKDQLLILEKTSSPLNAFRAEMLYYSYKQLWDRLKKK